MARADELFEVVEQVVEENGERNTLLDALEDYYFLENAKADDEKAEDEGIEVVRLPNAPNAIDLVQDLLAGAKLTITVPAAENKPKARQRAETAERFLKSLLRENETAGGVAMMARCAWLAAMRGCVAGRVVPADRWMDKTEGGAFEVKSRIPLQVQARDPRTTYPRFGADGLICIVEQWERTAYDVKKTVGEGVLPKGVTDTDTVTWSEYWDDKEFCYWVDGLPVGRGKRGSKKGPWKHGYGCLPYVFAFARQTAKEEPEKRIRPMLASMRGVLDRIDLMASQEATFISKYNGDVVMIYSDEMSTADPNAEEKRKLDLRPGAQNWMMNGEKVEWLHAGRQPLELQSAMARYEQQWERGTFPGTMYGQDPGRIVAGYAVNLLNQAGQVRLKPIIECVEWFLSELLGKALTVAEEHTSYLVEPRGQIPFYTYGEAETDEGKKAKVRSKETFDAAGMDGAHQVDVSLGDILPQDEQVNLAMAKEAVGEVPGGGLLSWETSIEKFKLTDSPSVERQRLDREAAMQDPEIAALRVALNVAVIKRELADELKKLDIDPDEVIRKAQPQPQVQPQLMPPMMPQAMPEQGMPPGMMPGQMAQPMPGMELGPDGQPLPPYGAPQGPMTPPWEGM